MGLGVDGDIRQPCLSEDEANNFVRGALTGRECQAVEFHLDSCDQCLQFVAALAQAFSSQGPSSETMPDTPTAEARPTPPGLLPGIESATFHGTERFRLLRRLGAGGMGVVYEAFDREHRTRIALKLLPALAPHGLLRFKTEFRALQDLHHPNLVRMGELFVHDGQWFFTMELVEGTDFLHYTRVTPSRGEIYRKQQCDESRLRSTLRQLATGLNALHASGKVHRDIKPKNTLVTTDGRLVILDFGLVQALDVQESTDLHAVGTVAYMAPEQAAARLVGPAADWYSVGVMLFQAITGRLPFSGAPLEILVEKQVQQPRLQSEESTVSPELAALCTRLLRLNPEERPDGEEVLRVLGEQPRSPVSQAALVSLQAVPFVGRTEELLQLRAALEATTTNRASLIIVEGESGIGKTALVRQFCSDLRAERPEAVILKGRCYERESVAYKAFDGILDALSRFLVRLPAGEAASLLPRWRTGVLAQVFPVLGRVPAVADAPTPEHAAPDPQEMRSQLFSGLRSLFTRLGERQPLLLVIDDLQWADADSLALLGELMREPEPPALLLIATLRSVGVDSSPAMRLLPTTLQRLGDNVRTLHVDRLPQPEARSLAAALLRRTSSSAPVDPGQLAEEARGHPLYIDELVRHQSAAGTAPVEAVRLDDALWSRACLLDAPERQVLAALALAGGPLAQEVIDRATDLAPNAFQRALAVLRVEHLARTTGAEKSALVECYHDRVREAVVAHLDSTTQREIHRRLAMGLAGTGDAELLAIHWHAAGEPDKAIRFSIKAAEDAAEALAFARAARLYEFALRLIHENSPERSRLYERWGDMLANAGRGRESANAYLAAVPGTSDAETRLKLRRRAAEHFLTTGHVAEGLDTLRSVLAEVDLRLASTPERAVASLLLHRARVRLRGLGFQRRDASQIDARELARVDVGLSVGWGLAMVDFIRSADFHARTVLRALDAGEPARLSFVLCTEAAIRARGANSAGALAYARAMLQVGSELATQLGDPGLIATAQTNEACIDFVSGHWRRSLELFDEAIKTFRERCAGFWWQRDLAVTVSVLALTFAGRLRELSARISQWSGEAIARGNLYLETSLRLNAMVRIAADDAVGARREAADAIGRWATGCFDFQHFQERVAQCYVGLYLGDGVAAYRCMAEAWPSLKAARMLHAPIVSVLGHAARARAAILAARQAGDRKILLRQAAADAKKIRRQRMLWSEPMARLIEAGCAATLERLDVARDDLTVAVQGFDDADMALEAAAARRRLGELVGGDEGRALLAQSDEYMHQQGIRCPERMMAVVAPGFTEPRAY